MEAVILLNCPLRDAKDSGERIEGREETDNTTEKTTQDVAKDEP